MIQNDRIVESSDILPIRTPLLCCLGATIFVRVHLLGKFSIPEETGEHMTSRDHISLTGLTK